MSDQLVTEKKLPVAKCVEATPKTPDQAVSTYHLLHPRAHWICGVLTVTAVVVALGCGSGTRASAPTTTPSLRWIDQSADWSPDGRSIVFASDRTGEWNLYLMDANGRNLRPLTRDKQREEAPQFFRSGEFLFGVASKPFCQSGADSEYVLSADGRVRGPLATGGDVFPGPSPDRRWIAYETSSSDLYIVRPDGSEKRRVSSDVDFYEWSPDSRMLAYDAVLGEGSQVYVVAIPNGHPIQLSHSAPSFVSAWSPDGRELEYTDGAGREVLIRPDGSDRHIFPAQLPDGTSVDAWLRNGDRLVSGDTGAYLLGSDGRVQRQLLKTPDPVLVPSPDGSKTLYEEQGGPLAYRCPEHPAVPPTPRFTRIDEINLKTGRIRRLTQR
jgi:dipeptidyl aminopeptidase/acylaminoacyl peptidase